ncbi:asparaginase [Salipiger bermudensis]|uniref:asparaginase n=1 Tax=Salipiger bermudensis TaxID=344736 RepID=UPI00300B902D
MSALPHIGLIVAGGTITALAEDPFEINDYGHAGSLSPDALLERSGQLRGRFDVTNVPVDPAPSFDMGAERWAAICAACAATLKEAPSISGFVLTHGTGALPEAAFFLSLCWDLDVPLVVTGAQRPASAQGADGPMNLFHALTAAADQRLGGSVAVAFDGVLHDPRDVTKLHNSALDTFRSPRFGPLGRFAGSELDLFARSAAPGPLLPWHRLGALPRVDILHCHSDGDAAAIEAFIAAGARGIVIAGFAPGYATSRQAKALETWVREGGGIVIAASQAFGRVPGNSRNRGHGFLPAAGFSPAKARILLQYALASQRSPAQIAELFDRRGEAGRPTWRS